MKPAFYDESLVPGYMRPESTRMERLAVAGLLMRQVAGLAHHDHLAARDPRGCEDEVMREASVHAPLLIGFPAW
ncbi:MAG: hypothetical protein GXY76_03105 [Chloroflexi bacterium]|nr:hypothetical protein [Chloroflexota bacterium]